VIALETGWPNKRMIVSREAAPGGLGRTVRTFEHAFRKWARQARLVED